MPNSPQARTDSSLNAKKHHFGAFWPGGSRFGAQASDLSPWARLVGWSRFWDSPVVYQEGGSAGQFGGDSNSHNRLNQAQCRRPANFGYRFCVRQAPNRPRWALWAHKPWMTSTLSATTQGIASESTCRATSSLRISTQARLPAAPLPEQQVTWHDGRLTNASAMMVLTSSCNRFDTAMAEG